MKDIPNAMLLNFNIQTLLKTVVISPNAKDYFLKPFLNLIEHYGISPDIVRPSDI